MSFLRRLGRREVNQVKTQGKRGQKTQGFEGTEAREKGEESQEMRRKATVRPLRAWESPQAFCVDSVYLMHPYLVLFKALYQYELIGSS